MNRSVRLALSAVLLATLAASTSAPLSAQAVQSSVSLQSFPSLQSFSAAPAFPPLQAFLSLPSAVALPPLRPPFQGFQPLQPQAPSSSVRRVIYHPRDLVSLRTRLRYTTLIVLPEGEEVVEATCGDRDRWLVNVREGLISVKPTEAGIASNLNLVATSGSVYAFLLSEQSNTSKSEPETVPDLTVYLEREEAAFTTASEGGAAGSSLRPKFVSADQIDDFRQQADLAREQAAHATTQARADLEAGLTAYRTTYPLSMRFSYRVVTRKGPFRIRAMWHDDHRTFIQTTASELPALYEYVDRQPALVNFEVHDGTYVVPRVLRDGYFQLGAARLGFRTQEGE